MNRGYTREWYMDRIAAINRIIPDCSISTDIITGFCGETEEEHQDTLSLMEEVKFQFSYMFFYSERPKTLAERKFEDDIPLETKKRRLQEVIDLQHKLSNEFNKNEVGKVQRVLIEGFSKKSEDDYVGRNSGNVSVIFPKEDAKPGDYVDVEITDYTPGSLLGKIVKS